MHKSHVVFVFLYWFGFFAPDHSSPMDAGFLNLEQPSGMCLYIHVQTMHHHNHVVLKNQGSGLLKKWQFFNCICRKKTAALKYIEEVLLTRLN